jgi:hypothetical protein
LSRRIRQLAETDELFNILKYQLYLNHFYKIVKNIQNPPISHIFAIAKM